MAPAFVQSASNQTSVGITSIVKAFASNNTAGNAIIVAVVDNTVANTITVTDSQGNTYSSIASVTNGLLTEIQLFYAFNIKAGANTVTASFSLSSASVGLAIHEFSGIDTFDVESHNTGTGNSQTSNSTATTAKANELLFGFTGISASNGLVSITKDSAYTLAESKSDSTPVLADFLSEYEIVSSTGTYAATTTTVGNKGGTVTWATQIATFYKSSTGSSGFLAFFQ